MPIDPRAVLGPNGPIAKHLPGYEIRQEQLQMADAVAHAIESNTHLMVEAGTGVGKSFGYLVPAILAATELGKKIVVSTRTINLQEQLIGKDLPFLQSVMPQEFAPLLVKGRSNYVSIRRLQAAAARRWRCGQFQRIEAARGTPRMVAKDQGRIPVRPRAFNCFRKFGSPSKATAATA